MINRVEGAITKEGDGSFFTRVSRFMKKVDFVIREDLFWENRQNNDVKS